MAKREVNMARTIACRLEGQSSGGPSGVAAQSQRRISLRTSLSPWNRDGLAGALRGRCDARLALNVFAANPSLQSPPTGDQHC
jgi:hypothetical protein